MMAEYRQVQCSFWDDAFVLGLTPEEKYFFLYLMTNPKTSQCGAYELPLRVAEFQTGFNSETVNKLFARFNEFGKVVYDAKTQEVYLVNWLRHNWIDSPKVIPRVLSDANKLKSNRIRKEIDTVLIPYGYRIDTVAVERREEKEKEREEENKPSASGDALMTRFATFWLAYPKKRSRGDAEKAWKRIKPNEQLHDRILHALEQAKTSADWLKDNGQFIPHPATWLNAKGWEDELSTQAVARQKEFPR